MPDRYAELNYRTLRRIKINLYRIDNPNWIVEPYAEIKTILRRIDTLNQASDDEPYCRRYAAAVRRRRKSYSLAKLYTFEPSVYQTFVRKNLTMLTNS